MAVFLAVLGIHVVGFPTRFSYLTTITPPAKNYSLQLSEHNVAALQMIGWSPSFYYAYILTLELLVTIIFLLTAALLFWRRSDDRAALLISLALVVSG